MSAPATQRSDRPLIVGLDMGSTNVKAVIYEPDGRRVALASAPAITHYPQPAWGYYKPEELWESAVAVLREAVSQIADPGRIAGIAVASVGEAGVPLDRHGEPTYDAIAWFDRRTIPQADWLGQTIGEDALFATTGLSLQPIYGLCKLLWLKQNEPGAFARTVSWLNIADYMAFKLCGEQATDWSLASRSLAFRLRDLKWDAGILRDAGIPIEMMAPAVGSGARLGRVTPEAAAATGLPTHAFVAAGGHDHICGAMASGAVRPGQVLDSMGTAEAILVPLERPLSDPEVGREGYTQGAHVVAGRFYLFGGLYTAGACVDWAHKVYGAETELSVLLAEAAKTPAGSLGVGFIPHLRLATTPHSDPRARAAFVGLTTDVDRGAIMRAVLEGLAYEARSILDPMLAHAGLPKAREITVIGGSAKNELLVEIKAAALNATLRILDLEEASALGAAILGGIGAGVYRDVDDALQTIHAHPREIYPDPFMVAVYETYFQQVYRELYAALKPLNHRIHALTIGEGQAL